jgi:SAM-dependent methyltransferase
MNFEIVKKALRKIMSLYPRYPVIWGSLRRLTPISRVFGYDRGPQSVARYYIDQFIAKHQEDICARVLEIGDNTYTLRFGCDRVQQSDVLHVVPGNFSATIVADLSTAETIPDEIFNCIILTHTLQFIYDFRSALRHLQRVLMPGGVLLATLPGISQISRYDMDRWGEYWRFTTLSTELLFEEFFPRKNLQITAHGNVVAAIALLHGLASRELRRAELDYHDPDYQVVITVRALKERP